MMPGRRCCSTVTWVPWGSTLEKWNKGDLGLSGETTIFQEHEPFHVKDEGSVVCTVATARQSVCGKEQGPEQCKKGAKTHIVPRVLKLLTGALISVIFRQLLGNGLYTIALLT